MADNEAFSNEVPSNDVGEGGQPSLLAVLWTSTEEVAEGMEYLKDYVGLWTHAPLEGKHIHVYSQKRKAEDPLADVLYWQDDTEHWRTGLREYADPDCADYGCGTCYFQVPDGPAAKYTGSYEVEGLTFIWNPSEEQQKQAEEEGQKAAEAQAKEFEECDQEAEREMIVEESAAIMKDEIGFVVEDSEGQITQEQATLQKFNSWDANGDNSISKEELYTVLDSISPGFFTKENIDTMAAAADLDKDDCINYKEFVKWIFKPDESDPNDDGANAGDNEANADDGEQQQVEDNAS